MNNKATKVSIIPSEKLLGLLNTEMSVTVEYVALIKRCDFEQFHWKIEITHNNKVMKLNYYCGIAHCKIDGNDQLLKDYKLAKKLHPSAALSVIQNEVARWNNLPSHASFIITPIAPNLDDVLENMILDYQMVENYIDFYEFGVDMGYTEFTDVPKVRETFEIMQVNATQMRNTFGVAKVEEFVKVMEAYNL